MKPWYWNTIALTLEMYDTMQRRKERKRQRIFDAVDSGIRMAQTLINPVEPSMRLLQGSSPPPREYEETSDIPQRRAAPRKKKQRERSVASVTGSLSHLLTVLQHIMQALDDGARGEYKTRLEGQRDLLMRMIEDQERQSS